MYCQQCGSKNVDDAKFCNSCGARITTADQPPAAGAESAKSQGVQTSGVQRKPAVTVDSPDATPDSHDELQDEEETYQPSGSAVNHTRSSHAGIVKGLLILNSLLILFLIGHAFYYSYLSSTSIPTSVWVAIGLLLLVFFAYGRSLSHLVADDIKTGLSFSEVTSGMTIILFVFFIVIGGLGIYGINVVGLLFNGANAGVSVIGQKAF